MAGLTLKSSATNRPSSRPNSNDRARHECHLGSTEAHPRPARAEWLNDQGESTLYTTSVTLAEMLMGIELLPDGKRKSSLSAMLAEVSGRLFADRILPFEARMAKKMAEVNRISVSKGHNILFADCQIAAIAAFHGFAVATRDEAPFRAAGIAVINPWTA